MKILYKNGLFALLLIAFSSSYSHSQSGNSSETKSREDKWLEDITYFENEFLLQTKSFNPDSMFSCRTALEHLRHRIDDLSDNQISLELSKCVAMANNGHTNLFLAGKERIPLRFFWFSDGLYIVKSTVEYQHYLGAKVLKINSVDVEKVQKKLNPYMSGNDNWRKYLGSNYLCTPGILEGIGLSQADSLTLTLFHNQETQQLTLGTYKTQDKSDLYDPYANLYPTYTEKTEWHQVLETKEDLPLYLQYPGRSSFYRFNEAKKVAYFNYNSNPNRDTAFKFKKVLKGFLDSLKRVPHYSVIIDLRFNTGGNYLAALKLAKKTPKKLNTNSKIYLITSNMTYSAGVLTAARIKYFGKDKVVVVGEQIGDNLKFRSEGVYYYLPHSKLIIQDAKAEHDFAEDTFKPFKTFWLNLFFGVAAKDMKVDKEIRLSFEDYLNREDPIYNWIISQSSSTKGK